MGKVNNNAKDKGKKEENAKGSQRTQEGIVQRAYEKVKNGVVTVARTAYESRKSIGIFAAGAAAGAASTAYYKRDTNPPLTSKPPSRTRANMPPPPSSSQSRDRNNDDDQSPPPQPRL